MTRKSRKQLCLYSTLFYFHLFNLLNMFQTLSTSLSLQLNCSVLPHCFCHLMYVLNYRLLFDRFDEIVSYVHIHIINNLFIYCLSLQVDRYVGDRLIIESFAVRHLPATLRACHSRLRRSIGLCYFRSVWRLARRLDKNRSNFSWRRMETFT